MTLTPIEKHGDVWLKRDDLFELGGAFGGKVRGCDKIIKTGNTAATLWGPPTHPGFVTASSRKSPQAQIVARLAAHYGVPARLHMPQSSKPPTEEMVDIVEHGGVIVGHRPGHNSVVIRRAIDDAASLGWLYIPFGMESNLAIKATATQVDNIPENCKRLVVPVGSGMTLLGVLKGLRQAKRHALPVLGVVVGADPVGRLNKYDPAWRHQACLVKSEHDYHTEIQASVGGVLLDPIYEAKTGPYLKPGDCLWVVGIRTKRD